MDIFAYSKPGNLTLFWKLERKVGGLYWKATRQKPTHAFYLSRLNVTKYIMSHAQFYEEDLNGPVTKT